MHIRAIEVSEIDEAVQYVYDISCHKENATYGCPRTFIALYNHFKKLANHSYDQVLVCRKNGAIAGVMAIIVEPQYKYIECIGGPFVKIDYLFVAIRFQQYLRSAYASFHMDYIYPSDNRKALAFMKSIKATAYEPSIEMNLKPDYLVPASRHHFIHLMKRDEKEAFLEMHNATNIYWNNKRIFANIRKFHIYIIKHKKEVVGSAIISIGNPAKKEIYYLNIKEEYRCQGFGKRLLENIITDEVNGACQLSVQIDESFIDGQKLFKKVGVEETGHYCTFSVDF